ncbi:unnamed protein product [Linum tenue]|uniref:Glycosyltransferase n=1 Tax=Linum tenue TaxID=586396 RepID=A0AAV0JY00_9ROSI|nr:unnamed protein product [Linum tenue]
MANSAHCLVVPFPAQGHINPILQFSKRLIPKGIRITLAFTRFISATITSTSAAAPPDIRIATISDGYDGGGVEAANFGAYTDTFRQVGTLTLTQLIQKQSDAGDSVHCVIYDSNIPWCLDVAKGFGIMAAEFFTQSCAVDSIYYRVREGMIEPPVSGDDGVLMGFQGLPPLEAKDFPSDVCDDGGAYPELLGFHVWQFCGIEKADWILCNTVYELEPQEVDWLSNFLPFTSIGPTIPSTYLTNQTDTEYGLDIFKQPNNETCTNWLQNKPKGSVVYVSFGSMASLPQAQMEELYFGLNNSNHNFLWVVRESEVAKLLDSFSTMAAGKKGLIVPWCQQLHVLASGVVGCFVTHCGWNSTLEAVSLGVPMVAMPQWADQATNAKYVTDVWRVGVRARSGGDGGDGLVKREEIERCVREVMEGEKAVEIRRNGDKWKKVMKDAVSEDGSSDRNVREFVDSLIRVCLW